MAKSRKASSGIVKFAAITDTHGDMVDQGIVDQFEAFVKDWKPSMVFHLGDFLDARALRNGASIEEKLDRFKPDLEAAKYLISRLRPNVLLTGNHDYRLWTQMGSSNGFAASADEDYVIEIENLADRLRIELLPYHVKKGVYDLHGLKFLHGYCATMHTAKKNAEVFGNSISGHIHRFDTYSTQSFGGYRSMCSGCACKMDEMTYCDRSPGYLAQEKGFVYGIISEKTGEWNAWEAREIDGNIVLP